MTQKDKELLIQANGMLQGLAYGADANIAEGICTVSEMIDKVIEAEEKNETN